MLEFLSESARFIHIAFGAVGLGAFWFPVFARKGGPVHVQAGRAFKWCAYVVLAAAAAALTVRITSLALEGTTPFNRPGPFGFIIFLGSNEALFHVENTKPCLHDILRILEPLCKCNKRFRILLLHIKEVADRHCHCANRIPTVLVLMGYLP